MEGTPCVKQFEEGDRTGGRGTQGQPPKQDARWERRCKIEGKVVGDEELAWGTVVLVREL